MSVSIRPAGGKGSDKPGTGGKNSIFGVDLRERLRIRGSAGCGVSAAWTANGRTGVHSAGSARFGEEFPIDQDTLFQAGSVSKPMFALTLLRYADRGIIDIDADISPIVSDFIKGPLSFAALLSHRAGLNVHGFPGYRADHAPITLEDVLAGRGNTPKVRRIKPYGKQYFYSGGGITLAELAFERITGASLRDAFQKEVASPLGLERTGYFQPLDDGLIANAAFGGRLAYKEDQSRGFRYYPERAAAGLWTTPTELTKIGIALSRSCREGGLLRKETARRMLTPAPGNLTYGLCVNNLGGDTGWHGGWNEGFLTEWYFSLKNDVSAAVMINRSGTLTCRALRAAAEELFRNIGAGTLQGAD